MPQKCRTGNDHQIIPDHPACGFQHQKNQGNADRKIPPAPVSLTLEDALQINENISPDGNCGCRKDEINHKCSVEPILTSPFVKGFS
jgi:hypothetical protein